MEKSVESQTYLPLQQSPVYAEALGRLGANPRWIDLDCGRALGIERGRMRLVLRGPVWEEGITVRQIRSSIRSLARWPGVTVVTPDNPVQGFGLIPLVTPLHHAVWPLAGDLRARMAGKWRNGLRRAERDGLEPKLASTSTLEELIHREASLRQARRYRSLPDTFTRALPADCLRIWEWRRDGEMHAAMAFIRHGTSASYHLGWGSDVARKAGVHALMLTRVAETLAEEGVRWLDLGSVDGEKAPGLARFKLGTGAELRRLGATMLVLP